MADPRNLQLLIIDACLGFVAAYLVVDWLRRVYWMDVLVRIIPDWLAGILIFLINPDDLPED